MRRHRRRGLAPTIYLDEIDIIQMTIAAIEMAQEPPLETFGLFMGEIERKHRRVNFRIHFTQTLQRARRKTNQIEYDDKRVALLGKRYSFQAIGDFHSHPGKDADSLPSHNDLEAILTTYPETYPEKVFAIIVVNKNDSPEENGESTGLIVRRKTKTICYLEAFEAHFYFYILKEGLNAIPRNVATKRLVKRVYPRVFARKKIHKTKLKKRVKVI